MKNTKNQREFTRVPVAMEVEVVSGQSTIRAPHTKNVSLNGLLLTSKRKLPLGSDCHLTIFLGGRKNRQCIRARAKVVRVEAGGMALTFEEIIGADSFAHLRNLILYNSHKTSQMEKEFETHLGLKRRKRIQRAGTENWRPVCATLGSNLQNSK